MNRHSIRVLEFEKIRASLREHCLTIEADAQIRKERISTDRDKISTQVSLVGALRRCLQTTAEFPIVSFPETGHALSVLDKEGAVLEAVDLAGIAVFIRSSGLLRRYFTGAAGETGDESVSDLVGTIPDLKQVSEHILRYVDPDGTIREREIPELKRIRAQINRAQQDLQKEAQTLLGRDDMRRFWNASVPTQREGRTVLALKADHRGKVKGIIHEVSSTGATIFLEPDSLVARNNSVTEAESRYQAELLKILRELSGFCRESIDQMRECVAAVTRVDKVYARARYGVSHDCTAAVLTEDRIALRSARHPLLGEAAVPISIEFPEGKRLMVVTGPNTGGKTVSLKTIGLLAMMNQFGMEIPAAPGTELPVFSGIYADIGDEQSIEQSLSTFSGHMRNIGRILAGADEHSLVLLDELGSGTDPEEGGALAMAVLDELLALGSYAVITTHHGALKHYGFTQPAAANASVEFDMKSLRPTYRIMPGVPGSSHAIEVAAHMGMLRRVTRTAREYLSGAEYDTGRIIRTLTDREQELHRERETLQESMREIDRDRSRMDTERAALQERERLLKEGRLRELDAWSSRMRSELENLVRQVREGELTREKTLAVKEFIARSGEDLDRLRDETRTPPAKEPVAAPPPASSGTSIAVGALVRLRGRGSTGTVLRKSRGSKWQVQVGAMRLEFDESELTVLREHEEPKPVVAVSTVSARPSLEIDLRGMRLDEAVDEVERQLDQAILSGMKRFGIIHGTGEGVLQKGVRGLLSKSRHVRTYEYARPEDGGYGKTVVELQ